MLWKSHFCCVDFSPGIFTAQPNPVIRLLFPSRRLVFGGCIKWPINPCQLARRVRMELNFYAITDYWTDVWAHFRVFAVLHCHYIFSRSLFLSIYTATTFPIILCVNKLESVLKGDIRWRNRREYNYPFLVVNFIENKTSNNACNSPTQYSYQLLITKPIKLPIFIYIHHIHRVISSERLDINS